jgi:thiopurine S-methyltransferase
MTDSSYWLNRWQVQEIGFDQQEVNVWLQRAVADRSLQGETILVPLCGKSIDMWWLYEQGASVLGVELSAMACETFFTERGLSFEKITVGDFVAYRHGERLTLLCGDFFALTANWLRNVDWVYDRAALIALPEALRQRYAKHLTQQLPPSAAMLIVTFCYTQAKKSEPPYAVSDAEVSQLYQHAFDLQRLYHQENVKVGAHLLSREMVAPSLSVFWLTRQVSSS